MSYVRYSFICEPINPTSEILVALLAELEFESFEDNENGVDAYIELEKDDKVRVETKSRGIIGVQEIERKEIPKQNWNAIWEADYEPVRVDKYFRVRAPFHEKDDSFKYEMVIQPKMSFGTGHHETTWLMLKTLSDMDVQNLEVADAGSGTGVLAIAAKKMGANSAFAYDVEDWAYENTVENAALNNTELEIAKGDVGLIQGRSFDLILANINKNVLLSDMNAFANSLNPNGNLIISGFFITDQSDLESAGINAGLKKESSIDRNAWCSMTFTKSID